MQDESGITEYGINCIGPGPSHCTFGHGKRYFYDRFTFASLLAFGYLRRNGCNPNDIATILLKHLGYDECGFKFDSIGRVILFYNPKNRIIAICNMKTDDYSVAEIGIIGFKNFDSKKDQEKLFDIFQKDCGFISVEHLFRSKMLDKQTGYNYTNMVAYYLQFIALETHSKIGHSYFRPFNQTSFCEIKTFDKIKTIDNDNKKEDIDDNNKFVVFSKNEFNFDVTQETRMLKPRSNKYSIKYSFMTGESILIALNEKDWCLSFYKNRVSDTTLIGANVERLNGGFFNIKDGYKYFAFCYCMGGEFVLESVHNQYKAL